MRSTESQRQAALVQRMCAIEAALRSALEACGHRCGDGSVVVDGERIEFRCYEPARRSRVPLRPEERRHYSGQTDKQVLTPSGRPVLVARLAGRTTGERRWMDKAHPLEAQIDQIVARFEAIAREAKEERARYGAYSRQLETDMRRAARRLRREQLREERAERLEEMAADWQDAMRLRAFLDAMQTQLGARPSPLLASWLAWARDHVDAIDPLSPAGMAALEAFEASIDEPAEDEGEPHPDEEEWRAEGFLDRYIDELD